LPGNPRSLARTPACAHAVERGAFAGARSRDAFRVTTDEPPNTRQDADAGRFLAEIRVAPSQPLSFLTVRLVQRGESTVAQEVR
jgi:phage tail sheath protein FI